LAQGEPEQRARAFFQQQPAHQQDGGQYETQRGSRERGHGLNHGSAP
jgi:hypothetical protein